MTGATPKNIDPRDFAFREYETVVDLLKQSNQMIWTAYGVFFAVNSLLVTAFGLIATSELAAEFPGFTMLFQLVIAVTGIFLSIIAILVIRSIALNQQSLIKRGTKLETIIGAEIVSILANGTRRSPWPTTIGSGLFAGFWFVGFCFAVYRWQVTI